MTMNPLTDAVRLPPGGESIAPVRILDAQGQIVRVVSAEEFRRTSLASTSASPATTKRRRPRVG